MNEETKIILSCFSFAIIIASIFGYTLISSLKEDNLKYKQIYQEHLNTTKDIINKQITLNTTYENKINILRNSCDFVFGKSVQYSRCTEDLLKIYN